MLFLARVSILPIPTTLGKRGWWRTPTGGYGALCQRGEILLRGLRKSCKTCTPFSTTDRGSVWGFGSLRSIIRASRVSYLRGSGRLQQLEALYPDFYFTTIGAAGDTGESVALNRAPVRERAVAFVLLNPVLRVLGGKPLHQPVARHLGHDRGEGDDRHAEVALNDSALDIFLGRAQ